MSTEAMKLALEKIARVNACDYEYQAWAREALNHCEDNLHMVKQEQGEPVAWMRQDGRRVTTASNRHNYPDYETRYSIPLYTTSQQRTWVELTDEEIEDCYKQGGIGRAIQMLKGKNT